MPTNNLQIFTETYTEKLTECVREMPDEYAFPESRVPLVVEKMTAAIQAGTFNHDGHAIRRTCRALGIKYTRKAIVEFVSKKDTQEIFLSEMSRELNVSLQELTA